MKLPPSCTCMPSHHVCLHVHCHVCLLQMFLHLPGQQPLLDMPPWMTAGELTDQKGCSMVGLTTIAAFLVQVTAPLVKFMIPSAC